MGYGSKEGWEGYASAIDHDALYSSFEDRQASVGYGEGGVENTAQTKVIHPQIPLLPSRATSLTDPGQ
jgi:hypothetical protein